MWVLGDLAGQDGARRSVVSFRQQQQDDLSHAAMTERRHLGVGLLYVLAVRWFKACSHPSNTIATNQLVVSGLCGRVWPQRSAHKTHPAASV